MKKTDIAVAVALAFVIGICALWYSAPEWIAGVKNDIREWRGQPRRLRNRYEIRNEERRRERAAQSENRSAAHPITNEQRPPADVASSLN